ncbi:MAG TPA: hypothetical protein VFQ68_45825 [Streptosporangiaceae bacterium]|nr:hypothetical protein [Streptosporangiaceae bacterium]
MTVHLISVGLSVLKHLHDPSVKLADKPDLLSAIRDEKPDELLAGLDKEPDAASGWLAAALAGGSSGRETEPARRLREAAAAARPGLWPDDMSAEIQTCARTDGTGYPLRDTDIVILICSHTPEGLLAGVWNALALTGGDRSCVRYFPEPGELDGKVRGRTVLVRVTSMNAADDQGFRQAMGGLGLLARRLFESRQLEKHEEFRFYLSGGFKAAVPYLIGLAEAVRSVDADCLGDLGVRDIMPDDGPYPVTAFVRHETAGPRAPSIRLPLRRLDAGAVRYELREFDQEGRRRGKPDGALLDGYAYECVRKKCTLTAFGEGLRQLFGDASGGFRQ